MCGGRRGRKTVNVPFLIPQRAHKVPFLIIQRAPEVPFFYKVIVPFFVPGVNTIEPVLSLTPAVKFLDLIFRNNFFIFNFSNMSVRDESCRGDFPFLWRKQIFVYIDEDFAIN